MDFFTVGSLRFNPKTLEVGGEHSENLLTLEQRPMRLIEMLAKGGGSGCTREELLEEIWKDKVVSDESLTNLVSQTRAKLKPFAPKLIKTVPKKGYILDGEISWHSAQNENAEQAHAATSEEVHSASPIPSNSHITASTQKASFNKLYWVAAIILLLAGLYAIKPFQNGTQKDRTIAVLPIKAVSSNQDFENGAKNFTTELTNHFSNFPGLNVVSQSQTERVNRPNLSIQELSELLHARYLIEGSIRDTEEDVKIEIRLVSGDSGLQLFSNSISATKQKFNQNSDQIIQAFSRVVLSEFPHEVVNTEKSFNRLAIKQKCESYVELSELYADSILNGLDNVMVASETACIAHAQLNPNDLTALTRIAELYKNMAIAQGQDLKERDLFLSLARQYLEKAAAYNATAQVIFEIRAIVNNVEINSSMLKGEDINPKLEVALQNLESGLELYPLSLILLEEKASTYMEKSKEIERLSKSPKPSLEIAEESLKTALEIAPERDVLWGRLSDLQFLYASHLNAKGQSPVKKLAEAVEYLSKAIMLAPENPHYYQSRGNTGAILADMNARSGNPDRAEFERAASDLESAKKLSKGALQLSMSLADAYRRRALLEYESGNDPSEFLILGIKHGKNGVLETPDYPYSYFALMEVYRNAFKYDYATGKTVSNNQKQCTESGKKGAAIKADSARAWFSILNCEQLQTRIFIEQGLNDAASLALKHTQQHIDEVFKPGSDFRMTVQIKAQNEFLIERVTQFKGDLKAATRLENHLKANPDLDDIKVELIEIYLHYYQATPKKFTLTRISELLTSISEGKELNAEIIIQRSLYENIKNRKNINMTDLLIQLEPFGFSGKTALRKYEYFL